MSVPFLYQSENEMSAAGLSLLPTTGADAYTVPASSGGISCPARCAHLQLD